MKKNRSYEYELMGYPVHSLACFFGVFIFYTFPPIPIGDFITSRSDKFSGLMSLVSSGATVIISAYDFAKNQREKENVHIRLNFLVGILVFTIGYALRAWCMSVLSNSFSFAVESRDRPQLVTWGPYRLIRHPIYTSLLIMFLSFAITFGSYYGCLTFVILGLPTFFYRAGVEEGALITQFGQDYKEYIKKTWRFVPYVF